jgi:hypothetical protein
MRLRSDAMWTRSRWYSSEVPSYQGMFSERSTMLSPCSAEIGKKVTSWRSSRDAHSENSAQMRS